MHPTTLKLISIISILTITSCSYNNEINPIKKEPSNISYIAPPATITNKLKRQPKFLPASSWQMSKCIQNIKTISKNLNTLAEFVSKKERLQNSPLMKIAKFDKKNCTPLKALKTNKVIAKYINQHSNKIGVLLDFSGRNKSKSLLVLKGIGRAAAQLGLNFKKYFITKDTQGTQKKFLKSYADLVFRSKVSLIISGLEKENLTKIISLSQAFKIPSLILNSNKNIIKNKSFSFQVFPLEKHMAQTIAESLVRKGFSSVGILRPTNGHSDQLITDLEKEFEKYNINIVKKADYNHGQYESMNQAVKTLANIDYIARKEEFEQLYKDAEEQAHLDHIKFNSKTVLLSPQIDFQALIIPDDFRIVRYFSKLLKYHRVEGLHLVGNHEWRSRSLIEPWDKRLQGSWFIDFVGRYNKLPKGILEKPLTSPYFTDALSAGEIDFKMIGFRAGHIAARTIKKSKSKFKNAIPQILSHLRNQNNLFSADFIFNKNRQCQWPTYIYSIDRGGLIPLSPQHKIFNISQKNKENNRL